MIPSPKSNSLISHIPKLLILAIAFTVVVPVPNAEGRTVSRKVYRKFAGVYRGIIRGFTVENNGTFDEASPFRSFGGVVISRRTGGSNRKSFTSVTDRVHNIYGTRPKGNSRRIRVKGVYRGTFYNPETDEIERISGTRRATLRKKGRGKRTKYLMKYRDNFYEGTLSSWNLAGSLRKR